MNAGDTHVTNTENQLILSHFTVSVMRVTLVMSRSKER